MNYLVLPKGRSMKSIQRWLVIVFAMCAGIGIGAFLMRPPQVRAVGTVYVDKVTAGNNAILGDQIVGFGCTQTDCYIASR